MNGHNVPGLTTVALQQGYSLAEALAELVDNALDARATEVTITFVRDDERVSRVLVKDNGHGLCDGDLREAMRMGASRKVIGAHGHFGIGLKSASLSQAPSFWVAARHGGRISGYGQDADGILDKTPTRLTHEACHEILSGVAGNGTVVAWHAPHEAGHHGPRFEASFNRAYAAAALELSRTYHRIIYAGGLKLAMAVERAGQFFPLERSLNPVDPFAGARVILPITDLACGGIDCRVGACAFPPDSQEPKGCYVYRHGRLVQRGGWGKSRGRHSPSPWAGVSIELASSADRWLSPGKVGYALPGSFYESLLATPVDGRTLGETIALLRPAPSLRPRRGPGRKRGDATVTWDATKSGKEAEIELASRTVRLDNALYSDVVAGGEDAVAAVESVARSLARHVLGHSSGQDLFGDVT